MAGKLNINAFKKIKNNFISNCTSLLIEAYHTSKSNEIISLDFDENDITAILHHYIDQNPKRKTLEIFTNTEHHLFNKTKKYSKKFASKFSRIDLRFTTFWKREEYIYYIEAKNLRASDSGLKRRYINTGIDNFLKGGKYENCDGLLVGYVLEGTKYECINGINNLLEKDNRNDLIIIHESNHNFDFYLSSHKERLLSHTFLEYFN